MNPLLSWRDHCRLVPYIPLEHRQMHWYYYNRILTIYSSRHPLPLRSRCCAPQLFPIQQIHQILRRIFPPYWLFHGRYIELHPWKASVNFVDHTSHAAHLYTSFRWVTWTIWGWHQSPRSTIAQSNHPSDLITRQSHQGTTRLGPILESARASVLVTLLEIPITV